MLITSLLLLSLLTGAEPQVRVRVGDRAGSSLYIPAASVGQPLDVAYDGQSRNTYLMSRIGGDVRVTCWSDKGVLRADWRLPADVEPRSVLYLRSGRLRCVCSSEKRQAFFEATFTRDRVRLKKLKGDDRLEHDLKLDGVTTRAVRSILKEAGLEPFVPATGGIVGGESRIDIFPVNARRLDASQLDWADDLSVVSLGREHLLDVKIAARQENGTYRTEEIDGKIRSALGLALSQRKASLLNILASRQEVVYGIVFKTKDLTEFKTVWVDLREREWRVSKQASGLLARRLLRY